jgi:hypothetical protein
MRDQITNDVSTCSICQTQKKQSKKYGLLPEKEAEAMPWDRLCVNLIGPYNIKSNVKGVKIPPLKCVTMIDPATGWFEIKQYDDKKSITVTKLLSKNGSRIIRDLLLLPLTVVASSLGKISMIWVSMITESNEK